MDPLNENPELVQYEAMVAEKKARRALEEQPDPTNMASADQNAPETPSGGEELLSGEIDPEVVKKDGPVLAIAKGLVNGSIKAGQSISDLMAEGINSLGKAAGVDLGLKAPMPGEDPGYDLPVDLKPNTAIGGITQGAVQFLWHFALTRGAGAGPVTGGAIADFTAFTADEKRFSNFLIEFDNPVVNNTFTQYLAAQDDDGAWEGRFKNVLEGAGLGVIAEGLFAGLRGIKNSKMALAAGDSAKATKIMKETRKQVDGFLTKNSKVLGDMLDNANKNADELAASPTKKGGVGGKLQDIVDTSVPSYARLEGKAFTDPEAVKQTVEEFKTFKDWAKDDVLKYLDGKLAGKIDTDAFETSADAMAFSEFMADVRMPEYKVMPREMQAEIAKAYGMPIEALKQYEKIGAVNSHVLLSSKILLSNQAERVTSLIKGAAPDDEILREVRKYDEFLNLYTSFSNIAGRTLDAHQVRGLSGQAKKDLMTDFMTDRFGGERGFAKFKEAWMQTGNDLGEIQGLLKQSKGRIATDTALEIWKNSILSGIKTFNVNLFGGVLNTVMHIPIRVFEGAASGIRTAGREGAERVYPGEALAMVAGDFINLQEALVTSWRMAKNSIDARKLDLSGLPKSMRDPAESGFVRKFAADNWGIGTAPGATARFIKRMSGGLVGENLAQQTMRNTVDTVGAAINTPVNLLSIQDGFVQNFASRQQRYALAYRRAAQEGVSFKDIPKRISELIKDEAFLESTKQSEEAFAKRVTFQEEMGPWGQSLDRFIRQTRPLNVPVMEFVMPFRRTPYNIFKQGVVDMNPVFGAPQAFRTLTDTTMTGLEKDAVLGRYAFGSSVAGATALMVISGNITGAGPSDPKMKQNLMRAGWKPYSFRVQMGEDSNGNPQFKYYQYNRLEPFSYLVGSMASTIETMHYTSLLDDKKEQTFGRFAAAINSSMMEATLDKSFFTGVQEMFLLFNDPVRYQEQWTARFGSSFVPAISRDIETMLQEKVYLRDTRKLEDAINAKLIGKSGNVPVVRNRWGDPIEMDPGWFLGTRSYFSPIGMGEGYAEDIDREIVRLGIEGVDTPEGTKIFKDALLSMPKRVIMSGGNDYGVPIRLDPEQYSRLIEIAGKEIKLPKFPGQPPMTMRDALNHLVTETEWYKAAAPFPASQAKLIKIMSEDYDKFAREQLIQEYPELKAKVDKARTLSIQSTLGMPGVTEETRQKLMELMGDGTY